mmetsp:Transcript_19699/g.34954  ORF Transcript_19699/g.34954 Transcript_19699/m.34954 type:complete len:159 (+) Transcript_19699:422-898(+)
MNQATPAEEAGCKFTVESKPVCREPTQISAAESRASVKGPLIATAMDADLDAQGVSGAVKAPSKPNCGDGRKARGASVTPCDLATADRASSDAITSPKTAAMGWEKPGRMMAPSDCKVLLDPSELAQNNATAAVIPLMMRLAAGSVVFEGCATSNSNC